MHNTIPSALIITGPTASGKTHLSYLIARNIPAEIINVDVGQFYTPLAVGTAKPDWKNSPFKHHLFDLLDSPQDINAYQFRTMVLNVITDITQRGKLPILVGGSLFYLKSLFFPPSILEPIKEVKTFPLPLGQDIQESDNLWNFLHSIDPDRASQLHKNDLYRIKRALTIWNQTGQKPSTYTPNFLPTFNVHMIALVPPRDELKNSINTRTITMIENEKWIDEARLLIDTPWESFLKTKGLIGYETLFEWIRSGEKKETLPKVIEKIQQQTWHYAKRQLTFLNRLLTLLCENFSHSSFLYEIVIASKIR